MTLHLDPYAADCPGRQVLDRIGGLGQKTLRAPIAALEGWAPSRTGAGRRVASRSDG